MEIYVTKKNLEDAATELSINNAKVLDIKSNIETIISNIKIAESQVDLAQRNLTDTVYRAPFSGKLDNSFIEVGSRGIYWTYIRKAFEYFRS